MPENQTGQDVSEPHLFEVNFVAWGRLLLTKFGLDHSWHKPVLVQHVAPCKVNSENAQHEFLVWASCAQLLLRQGSISQGFSARPCKRCKRHEEVIHVMEHVALLEGREAHDSEVVKLTSNE